MVLFQEYVNQHPLFDEFMPPSVATLRLTTTVDSDGSCRVKACYLRLGRAGETHVKSESHVRVPIDPKTGQFAEEGYLPSWLTIDRHPDSKTKFAGMRIPNFSGCVPTVLRLKTKLPFVRCIGWDVAIDKNADVKILEWNGDHNDIKFSEATQGPCFANMKWETLWHR
jgi:hypothetical protein